MARRKMTGLLINRSEIQEEMRLINGSDTDYVTPTGNIYKDYGNDMFYHKSVFPNKVNGYLYCGITYREGQRQRRVHILVAEAFLPNPNNYPVVMHIDNDKTNCSVENLKWGTTQENTKQAFKDKLQINAKSWEDSQSIAVCCFDLSGNLLNKFGSVGEASRTLKVTKTAILNQCNHKVKTKPRCGYWFRYLTEYESSGFVL